MEEAAASLGATRLQTRVAGAVAHRAAGHPHGVRAGVRARAGEYGSIIFIAGNKPLFSEIAPLLITIKLEEFDYAGATAVAVAMLVLSLLLLVAINGLQAWSAGRHRASGMKEATSESRWVQWLLIGVALAFLLGFLLLPLISVFFEALRNGWEAYRDAIFDPDARAAIKPHVAGGCDRGAAEPGVRRRPRPGRWPSSSSAARPC